MKLTLEITFTSDITFYGTCGCRKWRSEQYNVNDSRFDVEREELFGAWGEHCKVWHRPRGVDVEGKS